MWAKGSMRKHVRGALLCVLLASFLLVCPAEDATKASAGKSADPLDKAVEAASESQMLGEKMSTKAKIVEESDEVELTAGDGDIDTSGACEEDIQIFCPQVKPGLSHIAECLDNQVADEVDGRSEFTARVSDGCKDELFQFKVQLSTNINFNVPMAKACKSDAKKFCDYTKDLKFPGKVIACLRENKPDLTNKCQEKITEAQLAAAQDYRLDAQLYETCKADAETVCKDVKAGSGRVNACLRENRMQVSWECQEELFRADVENADDIRLSVKLFQTCINEKRKFCPDVAPGHAKAQLCLEKERDKPGFGEDCKALLEKVMEDRARDFRLDVNLREHCGTDIELICQFEEKTSESTSNSDSRVIECLQDYHEDLTDPACSQAVHATMVRAGEDIRFAVSLAEACYDDRQKYCGNVQPGSARVVRCLQDRRDLLREECRATLFDHEVRMSESIDFNLPMKKACTAEIGKFCADVPSGHARVIRCLQDHKGSSDFGKACKKEVTDFEHNMNRDYRLNFRLATSCEEDVYSLCPDVCDLYAGHACGGRVLRCLSDNREKLKGEACKQEVFYFIKMEVTDFGNDVILAEACRQDVDELCAKVEPGDGRIHECLRSKREKLSMACRKEELALEIQEAQNFELRPSLKRACAEERSVFCKDVRTGGARVFRCLVSSLGKADFGDVCKSEVMRKLQRRQQNWKLDVNLRRACRDDADRICADVDHDADHAEVTRCLISKRDELADSCLREVSRAAHMSLLVWQGGSAISQVCDSDINKTCLASAPMMANSPGKVLSCLEKSIQQAANGKKAISAECKALVDIAEPPDAMADMTNNLNTVSMKQRMSSVGVWDNRKGITLTGYTALACFSALCTSIIMGLTYGYRQWRGIRNDGYVTVVKRGDV